MQLMRLARCSTIAPVLVLAGIPFSAARASEGQPAGWEQIAAALTRLEAARSQPDLHITTTTAALAQIEQDGRGWQSPVDEDVAVARVRFTDRNDRTRVVDYIFAPWERLSWRGSATDDPVFVTATPQVIVFGPVHAAGASDEMKALSRKFIESVVNADAAEIGMSIGSPPGAAPESIHPSAIEDDAVLYLFRPAYVHIMQPAGAAATVNFVHEMTWEGVAQSRLIIVVATFRSEDDSYRRIEIHPPTHVDRSRPAPHDPFEQRLAPDVDLAAAESGLNARLRAAYFSAIQSVLSAGDDRVAASVQHAVESVTDEINLAVVTHPAYSGPAHAAAASKVQRALDELEAMLTTATLPGPRRSDWPNTLLAYRPALIPELAALPPAQPEHLPELLRAFSRLRKDAGAHPGRWDEHPPAEIERDRVYEPSDDELLLAEIGDRIRTVIVEVDTDDLEAALREAALESSDLVYDAFSFVAFGEDRGFERFVDARVRIRISE